MAKRRERSDDFDRVLEEKLTLDGVYRVVSTHVGFAGGGPTRGEDFTVGLIESLGESIGKNLGEGHGTGLGEEGADVARWYLPGRASDLWTRVKEELRLLICTKDKKYASIRRQIAKQGQAAQTAIIGAIAAAIGATLGVTAGVIAPLVALALLAMLKVGKEAYCAEPKKAAVELGIKDS